MALGGRMRRERPDGRGQDWAWGSLKGFAHGAVEHPRGEERRGLNNKGAKKRIKLEQGAVEHPRGEKRGGIEQQRR